MQNILHLIDSFDQGGTERQALQLVRLLQEAGACRVHLACLKRRGLLLPEAEKLGAITEFPLTSFYNANFVRQARRLRAYLREHDITLIHAHDFYTNFFGMTGAILARTPARIASKRETAFRTPTQQKLERLAFRAAQRIVANADAVRQWLINSGVPGGKIVTLYNGLDLARLDVPENWSRATACASFGLPATRRYVVIVANLRHEVKNHPMFLRAAQQVRAVVPDAGFLVAGEGELQPKLAKLAAELGIADDVFFLGRCTRVAELLALSEVCVLSSRAEGFSNSILEYMAAARPVVVTDVGGAREAVSEGRNGFLVPSDDDALMAQRLIFLLQNTERAQAMGADGRRTVREKFSCAAQLQHTQELYESLWRMKA